MSKDYYKTAVAITPHDTNPNAFDAIYVGGAGNVAVLPEGSAAAVTFTAPPVGTILPVKTAKVMSTNTTATLLVGLR